MIVASGCGFSKYQVVQYLDENYDTNKRIYHVQKIKSMDIEVIECEGMYYEDEIILFNKKKGIIKKNGKRD